MPVRGTVLLSVIRLRSVITSKLSIAGSPTHTRQPGCGSLISRSPGPGRRVILGILKTTVVSSSPRLVIWQYWVNDPRDDAAHLIGGYLPCPRAGAAPSSPAADNHSWLERHSILDNLLDAATQDLLGSEAETENTGPTDSYTFTTSTGRDLFAWRGEGASPDSDIGRSGFKLTTAAISLGARRSTAAGSVFLLLIAPSNLQVYADTLPTPELRAEMRNENEVSERLIAFADDNNIPYLDLRAVLIDAAHRGELIYPSYDAHWTPRGNEIVADALVVRLKELGIIAR